MNDVTNPNEPFLSAGSSEDLARATQSHVQGNWRISSRKLPISRAAEIDALSEQIGIPIPEMIFGDNEVRLEHVPTGWHISFRASEALDAVDKTGRDRLQVAHAGDWAHSRETAAAGIRDVRPYDWSYSTLYRGTECGGSKKEEDKKDEKDETDETVEKEKDEKEEKNLPSNGCHADLTDVPRLAPAPPSITSLPYELLRRRDPILFHDDVILYESELDDNGISMLRVKLRVMAQRMLLLSRLYMRLDHVLVRVRDTRVYVDFTNDTVLREYTAREAPYADVQRSLAMRGLRPDAVLVAMHDANQVADLLPIIENNMESLDLGRGS